MGPCTGHGSGGTRISSAYNIRWQVSIPSFKCVTFGHVIHKLVQHIPKEGGSEQEGDLSFKFHSIKVCNICYLASIFTYTCLFLILSLGYSFRWCIEQLFSVGI